MLAGAGAELATIGSLLPFLSLLAGVEQPAGLPSIARFLVALGATTPSEQVWLAAAVFMGIALIAGGIRVGLSWSTQLFTARLGIELSVDVQRRILGQPYSYHLTHNSSQALAAMDQVESLVIHVVLQLIYAFTAGLISLAIIGVLIYVQPFSALIAAAAFSLIYLAVSASTQAPLTRNSRLIAKTYEERVAIVQESIGAIRDVIIDGAQQIYLRTYAKVAERYSNAAAMTSFIAAAPRFLVEATGMAVIAIVAVLIATREGGLAHALPLLGAVALGAQRLLPLLQQVYHGWASVSGHRSSVAEVLELLRLQCRTKLEDVASVEPLPLRDRISIEKVSFSYPECQSNVLEDVSLEIPRGAVVGFVGKTGSGKSTLADLIMGLIDPTEGRIAVDGIELDHGNRQRWLRSIAHVPQSIFLGDTTIARNIAFGVEPGRIDMGRVRAAAAAAQLAEFVTTLPSGYETTVGERGIRLSGGQRQRLGIARAIYKQSPVLVLDEATSALDETTEASVMESLAALSEQGRTVIVIAHRASTLSRCDLLVRIEGGRIKVSGQQSDLASPVLVKR
jgi:ABC-type multidrug transport system fused ATPase/permease subunit